MFGRRRRHPEGEEAQIQVDATLEDDIARVERAVGDYVKDPSGGTRLSLIGVLEQLDDQTEQSDAYGRSVIGSAALGYASKGEVLGETGLDPVVAEVPSAELTAQFALVNAAKVEVRGPTLASFAALQAALEALAQTRS
jgi:hypothetical protein